MKALVSLLVLSAILLGGCSSMSTHRNRGVDLNGYQRYFVEHRLTDDRHLDAMIVAELRALGRDASFGPLTMMPADTDVLVTYEDVWAWDFKNYLIELTVQFHGARSERPLAIGSYRQPSMITKSPPDVIRAILTPLFSSS